jgi:CRISPR/Cas system Type II protein with McrA/HNH and RuvC-like nuclease domain
MAGKPVWRQVFDAVDRRVAGPVEGAARSDAFGDALALGLRLQRRVQRGVERRSRRLLHLANLPTATDVRRLSEQVSALRREVRELEERRG